mgnify:CR=1 FL=1
MIVAWGGTPMRRGDEAWVFQLGVNVQRNRVGFWAGPEFLKWWEPRIELSSEKEGIQDFSYDRTFNQEGFGSGSSEDPLLIFYSVKTVSIRKIS